MFSYLAYFIGPIQTGVIFFLLTFPFTLLGTHIFLKKKNISLFKKIGTYLMVCFLFLALGLVFFPFPDFSQEFCEARATIQVWQLQPFQFLQDIATFAEKNRVSLFHNKALFQVIFNIFLIFPIGFLGTIIFQWNFFKNLFVGFLLSLSFEIIQGTALFGIFPCAYRLFDVDDLMLNAVGMIFGFALAGFFRKKLWKYFRQKQFIIKKENFLLQRAGAFVLDIIIVGFLVNVGGKILHNFGFLHGIIDAELQKILFAFCMHFLYFVIFVYFFDGKSLGKRLFKLKIISVKSDALGISQLIFRSIIPVFAFQIFHVGNYIFYSQTGIVLQQNGLYSIWYFVYLLLFIPLSIELSTTGRALHDKMGGTRVVQG